MMMMIYIYIYTLIFFNLRITEIPVCCIVLPLGLSRSNRPEVVSHLRARSVSYRF